MPPLTDRDFEAENQEILKAYGAHGCEVVRNAEGEIIQAVAIYEDGTVDLICHFPIDRRRPWPAHVSRSWLPGVDPPPGLDR
jgi:hypothetical protein